MLQENIIRDIGEAFAGSSPGFHIYQEPKSEKYHTFFIDGEGRVLLLSKPYSTEHNCQNALQRFEQGKFVGEIKEDEQGFFIEFKSEGGKQIGISPNFEGQPAAEAALKRLSSPAEQEKALPADAGKNQATSRPQRERGEENPPRHSFRLDLYKGGKGSPVRGRIEYSLTQESAPFEGLDMNFVRSFIARHLEDRESGLSAVEVGGGKIVILESGQPSGKSVFSNAQAIEVQLDIDAPEGSTYDAFVYAKSLGDNRQALIGRKRGKGSPIRLSTYATGLTAGMYRLQATVHLEKQRGESGTADYSLSSKLFHLFSEQGTEQEELSVAR